MGGRGTDDDDTHEQHTDTNKLTSAELCVCVSRLAGGERKGGTSSQEHHSWSAATTTQSAASSAGQ